MVLSAFILQIMDIINILEVTIAIVVGNSIVKILWRKL